MRIGRFGEDEGSVTAVLTVAEGFLGEERARVSQRATCVAQLPLLAELERLRDAAQGYDAAGTAWRQTRRRDEPG